MTIYSLDILLSQFGTSLLVTFRGFPGGSDSKESACNAGDLGLILGSRRSCGEKNGYSLLYSFLDNSIDRVVGGGVGGNSPWGCKESDTIEWLTPTKHSNFPAISFKAVLTRRCIWSSELPQGRCEVGGQRDTIDNPLRSTKSGIRICCILPTYISHLSHFFCVLFLMVYQHLHQTVTEEDKAQTK